MLIYQVACTYIEGHASIELSTIRKRNSTFFRGRIKLHSLAPHTKNTASDSGIKLDSHKTQNL